MKTQWIITCDQFIFIVIHKIENNDEFTLGKNNYVFH